MDPQPEPMNAFQQAMAEIIQIRADLDTAYREYEELPPLPDGYDVRETFVTFRIAPLRDKLKGLETAADDLPIQALAKQERYQAPKLKGLEDIKALCVRNGAVLNEARREGVGTR